WRIKEEPSLWKRYWNDGLVAFRLMVTRVLPLIICMRSNLDNMNSLNITEALGEEIVTLTLSGAATASHAEQIIASLSRAMARTKRIKIDLSEVRAIDARFLGILLMLRKELSRNGGELALWGLPRRWQKVFCLNGLQYMLQSH